MNQHLGKLELEVLQYVSAHAPVTVREVADEFSASHSLARTTLLTVLERLRKKGFLTREKAGGSFQYSPAETEGAVLKGLVGRFIRETLGGSLHPLVAYLSEEKVSQEQLAELKSLVEKLDGGDDA